MPIAFPIRSTWNWLPDSSSNVRDRNALAILVACGAALWLRIPEPAAAATIVIAVIAAVGSPPAGIAATVLSFPFAYQPISLGSGEFSLLEIAVATVSMGTLISITLTLSRQSGWTNVAALFLPWQTTLAAAALLGLGTLSLAFVIDSSRMSESLRDYRWTIIEPIAFLVACRFAFDRPDGARLAVWSFITVGLTVGCAAIVETTVGGGLDDSGVVRAGLLHPHPNNLAFLLERTAVFVSVLALARLKPLWAVIVAGLVITGVGATFSRGALLGVTVGLGAVLLFSRHWRLAFMYLGGFVGLVAVMFGLVGDRLLDAGGGGVEATRMPIWRASARMVADHPLTGVGLDQFYYQYWRRYVEPMGWPERYTSHPHNIFFDVWLRLGILGLVWLALLVWAVVSVTRPRYDGRARTPIIWAAAAALGTGAIHGLVDNGYFLPDVAVMTWLLVAFLERPCRLLESETLIRLPLRSLAHRT